MSVCISAFNHSPDSIASSRESVGLLNLIQETFISIKDNNIFCILSSLQSQFLLFLKGQSSCRKLNDFPGHQASVPRAQTVDNVMYLESH